MALKDIYLNGIQKVIDGTLDKEDLWDVFEKHLTIERDKNDELYEKYNECKNKYEHLLKQMKNGYEEHKKFFGEK